MAGESLHRLQKDDDIVQQSREIAVSPLGSGFICIHICFKAIEVGSGTWTGAESALLTLKLLFLCPHLFIKEQVLGRLQHSILLLSALVLRMLPAVT